MPRSDSIAPYSRRPSRRRRRLPPIGIRRTRSPDRPRLDHIDPGPGLRPNDTVGRLPRGLGEGGLIHSLTPRHSTKHLHQPLGPRQAASVGGQDSAVATLHGYNHRERRNH